jgi:hypothetical protein
MTPNELEAYNAMTADRDHWKARFKKLDTALMCELRDPCGTIWEHAKRLQDDNDRYKAELQNIADATARRWEVPRDEFAHDFLGWAQSRARHALKSPENVKAHPPLGARASVERGVEVGVIIKAGKQGGS